MGSPQTSSTLASAFVTEARADLNEFTSVVFSDSYLLGKLNRGTVKIVAMSHCLDKKETAIALVENQSAYPITATATLGVKTVIYTQDDGVWKGLLRGNLQSIGHNMVAGEPTYWVESEDNLIIYPVPDADHEDSVADQHELDYYTIVRPTAVIASAAVLVPAIYDDALLFYMIASALFKDKKWAAGDMYMARCEAEIERYRADFAILPKEPRELVK